jgi:glutathione-specific gamma-glutamylcyclotransferase
MSDGIVLRRELLLSENADRAAEFFRSVGIQVATLEERAASLAATLARVGERDDVWVFGYGSLMWNPAFHHVEALPGRLPGWHRRFCVWNTFGRGSPDAPGLTLALESGGSCSGVAFRIAAAQVQPELTVLWNREMLMGSYVARWVRLHTARGPLAAVTFVANRKNDRYAGRLPLSRVAEVLAQARGPLGAAREYLERTVAELERLGASDGEMHALLRAVNGLI